MNLAGSCTPISEEEKCIHSGDLACLRYGPLNIISSLLSISWIHDFLWDSGTFSGK